MPCGNYPLLTIKNGGKIVVINLQPTRVDEHAHLIINQKLDLVFHILLENIMKIRLQRDPDVKIEINLKLDQDDDDEDGQSRLMTIKDVFVDTGWSINFQPTIEWKNLP